MIDTLLNIIPFAVIGFILFLAAIISYKKGLVIPKPNEALIISGRYRGNKTSDPENQQDTEADVVEAINQGLTEGMDFKISTTGTWVNPFTTVVSRLPLDSRSTNFEVQCHDAQKIACQVRGVILYKVGDNYPAMRAAARRFLTMDEEALNSSIRDLVTGQVRALVGGMTIPELITDRQKLMDGVRSATGDDMAKLGLQIDSLTIQDISDDGDYIADLGRPEAEARAKEASIAADRARQETERERLAADLAIAENERTTQVKAAEYQAEQDKAKAEAEQAGPLARAEAQKAVVAQETEVAELRVSMTEKTLDAEVRKRAEAERYATEQAAEANKAARIAEAEAEAARARKIGEAEAEATKARGEAEAGALRAHGEAEAAGIHARAEALSQHGKVVIDQKIADQMPEIARAFAEPLSGVDNMVVLDGPEGFTKGIVGAVSAAGEAIARIRDLPHDANPPSGGSSGGSSGGPGGGSGGGRSSDPDPSSSTQRDEISRRAQEAVESVRASSLDEEEVSAPDNAVLESEQIDYDMLQDISEDLQSGDLPRLMNRMETDEHVRDALKVVAKDESLLEDFLDRSNLTGPSRKMAEMFFSSLRERV